MFVRFNLKILNYNTSNDCVVYSTHPFYKLIIIIILNNFFTCSKKKYKTANNSYEINAAAAIVI